MCSGFLAVGEVHIFIAHIFFFYNGKGGGEELFVYLTVCLQALYEHVLLSSYAASQVSDYHAVP